MSKTQTEKSRYPSRYSPGQFVTQAQYIVEYICENQARYCKTELPIKFWTLPKWKKWFTIYIFNINRLLKKYSEKSILGAIKKYNVCTPFWKPFEEKIREEEATLSQITTNIVLDRPTKIVLPEKKVGTNKLEKLDI
jgi:hypothetical protein